MTVLEITLDNAPRDVNELKKNPPYSRGVLFRLASQLQLFSDDAAETAFLGQSEEQMATTVAAALQARDAQGGAAPAPATQIAMSPAAAPVAPAAPAMMPQAPVPPQQQAPQMPLQMPPQMPSVPQAPPVAPGAPAPQMAPQMPPQVPQMPAPQAPPAAPVAPAMPPPVPPPAAPVPMATPPQMPPQMPPQAPPAAQPVAPSPPAAVPPAPTPVTSADAGQAAPALLDTLRGIMAKQEAASRVLAALAEVHSGNNALVQEVHSDILGVARMLKLSLQLQLLQLEQQGLSAHMVTQLLKAQDPNLVESILATLGAEGKE